MAWKLIPESNTSEVVNKIKSILNSSGMCFLITQDEFDKSQLNLIATVGLKPKCKYCKNETFNTLAGEPICTVCADMVIKDYQMEKSNYGKTD